MTNIPPQPRQKLAIENSVRLGRKGVQRRRRDVDHIHGARDPFLLDELTRLRPGVGMISSAS